MISMIIGVTGKIGSGKSTFTKKLAKKEPFAIVDVDKMVITLYEDDDIKKQLLSRFGTDKKKELKHMVDSIQFLDDIAEIFAPGIQKLLRENLDTLKGFTNIILDAPLLFEYDMDNFCDITVSIHAKMDMRYKRVQSRSYMPRSIFNLINASQLSDGSRNTRATHVVDNNGTEEELDEEVTHFITDYI